MNSEKRILEIPIYSLKNEELNKKIKKREDKEFKDYKCGINDNKTQEYLKNKYVDYNNWRYNYIIGYIVVIITENGIEFKYYKDKRKRYNICTNKKYYIINQYMGSNNIRIKDELNTLSNLDIADKVEEKIKEIKKDMFEAKYYLDLEVFDNIIKLINFKNFWEE